MDTEGGEATTLTTFATMITDEASQLCYTLRDEIVDGSPASADNACRHLETARTKGWQHKLEKYRDPNFKMSLLHMAALFQQGPSATRLLTALVRLCPGLLVAKRVGEYQGQTALHIVVGKGNWKGAAALLCEMDELGNSEALLDARATGDRFANTVMDGELALHVAACTLNRDMVDLLLDHKAHLDAVNSSGDTVLHALVKFAGRHPEKTDEVIKMLNHLHVLSCKMVRLAKDREGDQLSVWFLENNHGLTPLKLAASEGAGAICAHIICLDGVYRLLNKQDGLFKMYLYDITELDPVTNKFWQKNRREAGTTGNTSTPRSKVHPQDVNNTQRGCFGNRHNEKTDPPPCLGSPVCCCRTLSRTEAQSVLEIICGKRASHAFDFINTDVVQHLVRSKWQKLQVVYFIWLIIHLVFMVGLTFYAIYRPGTEKEENSLAGQPFNYSNSSLDSLSTAHTGLVKAWPWLNLAMSVLGFGFESIRTFSQCQRWHIKRLYHNGQYRLILVLFSACLFTDSLWYWFDHHNADSNIFLILALLMGGWFLTFFLRAWRKFSFFTILFQKVLFGDMFRFSIMILLELFAFSAAMYVAYLPASASYPSALPDEFENIWTSILTMFRLMLGLSDIEILTRAPAPWVAVVLYVLFALLTYVLLLNSLIAMMSQTCSLVRQDRDLQWRVQRLSVLLLLDTFLPLRLRPLVGDKDYCRRYSLRTGEAHHEVRYLMPVSSVQDNHTDGKPLLRRQNLERTTNFEDLIHMLRSSHNNTFSSSSFRNSTKTGQRVKEPASHDKLDNFWEEQENTYLRQSGFGNMGNEPKGSKRAEFSREKTSVSHSSETKRRIQTESNKPLSRSSSDRLVRYQRQEEIPTREDNPHQPAYYLTVPNGSLLFHPNQSQNSQIGYLVPANLLQAPIVNSFSHNVATNDIQAPAQVEGRSNNLRQGLSSFAYQYAPGLIQFVQGASTSNVSQAIPVPAHSQQSPAPTQAAGMSNSPRTHFVDVNDLSTEA